MVDVVVVPVLPAPAPEIVAIILAMRLVVAALERRYCFLIGNAVGFVACFDVCLLLRVLERVVLPVARFAVVLQTVGTHRHAIERRQCPSLPAFGTAFRPDGLHASILPHAPLLPATPL